ncbi:GNAT family N-acetyltransferase [Schaalia sp. Marseille-Q2122]|uniref:GNAT family N-acetyltransferase n=1 Tax=Schaalia sp. Marseille-Q2122 TaxID=2736604 RepID=UPI00158C8F26|nr:GNAT family N-acetyltransferase [Schaalia sp. Marseille-Q2122]
MSRDGQVEALEPCSLVGERVSLMPLTLEDTADMHRHAQDPEIPRWTTVPSPYTRDMAEEWIAGAVQATTWDKGEPIWAIRLNETGAFIGLFSLFRAGSRAYEVGYWIGSDFRGQGYITEAMNLAADWAFTSLNAGRILWRAKVGNWPSWKSAWQCGFSREGIWRGVTMGDEVVDQWTASLLPGDERRPRTPWDGPGPAAGQGPALDPSQPGELVAQFHRTYSMPDRLAAGEAPTVDYERLNMRMGLIGEEFAELMGAVYGPQARSITEEAFARGMAVDEGARDVVEAADALADLIYVIYGMALESGINLDAVLAEVQASNLSKLMPDGSVKLREDGKVLKGPDFFPPNVARALGLD